jgi:hypothetical protein
MTYLLISYLPEIIFSIFIFPSEELGTRVCGEGDFADFEVEPSSFLSKPIDGGTNRPRFTETLKNNNYKIQIKKKRKKIRLKF